MTSVCVAFVSCNLSSFLERDFPAIDCHAHVSPDVTPEEVEALGSSSIFAMTRSLAEADLVVARTDPSIVWGCGVHPGLRRALDSYDVSQLTEHLQEFVLVGEVGLDRSGGNTERQSEVLRSILQTSQKQPTLVSLHSAGRTHELIALLTECPHPGAILHWFLGEPALVSAASEIGCYFSVNAAMSDDMLRHIPYERMLPETDFPSSRRRTKAQLPGDIDYLEQRISQLTGFDRIRVRRQWYKNLRAISTASGAIERLPEPLADRLLSA